MSSRAKREILSRKDKDSSPSFGMTGLGWNDNNYYNCKLQTDNFFSLYLCTSLPCALRPVPYVITNPAYPTTLSVSPEVSPESV